MDADRYSGNLGAWEEETGKEKKKKIKDKKEKKIKERIRKNRK